MCVAHPLPRQFQFGDLGPFLLVDDRLRALPPALLSPRLILLRDKVAFVLGLSMTW